MIDKRYKPGQLVTIDNKVYQIRDRYKDEILLLPQNFYLYRTCTICKCINKAEICPEVIAGSPTREFCCSLPYGYYLKRISKCGNQDS